nr:uncharacterized protein LOC117990447 [Maniola hyperantus]
MRQYKSVFALIPCFLLTVCFGEISIESKEKFLNGFVEYLNNLPDQIYTYDEGVLLNAQKTDDGNGCYYIEARLRANDIHNVDSSRYLKCSATIQDLEENGITIQNNQYQCEDVDQVTQSTVADADTLEGVVVVEQTTKAVIHQPVHLDNEVQSNTGVTSGEEFVAIPRRQYGDTCVGCSSHVNPQAPGVSDLAALGIKHLDRHEPTTKHLLQSVLDVERQVQVVNGVRYTLTLQVGFDNCTSTSSDPCSDSKVCRIAILEKTWIKLPDGSKYRAVLSNNCTQEWIFGDEGEYIPNNESNDIEINTPIYIQGNVDDTPKPIPDYDKIANTGSADEILKAIHNTDVQAQIKTEKSLTEKELRDLEEQVILHENIYKTPSEGLQTFPKSTEATISVKLHHVSEFQTKQNPDHSVLYKQPEYKERHEFLNEDRKKAIDDLMNFFNSAGFGYIHDDFPRVKRSYENELKVMSVAEKIHKIKKNINKAKYLYSLAQNMVDYLNEMDLEIKTRVLLDVIAAEEEVENYQNFFYIQAHVVIPCDKVNCEEKDIQNKICNGIIETTDQERPQILSAFCYNEQKKKLKLSKAEIVDLNDPVLLKLTKESLKKIELESNYPNAMKIEKILQAYAKRASGTVTKITVSLSYTNCNKTVSYMKRINCSIVQSMDSNVCEITVHERHWLQEKKITYTCAQRPIDETFSNKKAIYNVEGKIKDKKILDMTQEALQYLELNSNKNNKQKVVQINSVTTQLIAGLLTEIKFIVGYTTCSNDFEVDVKSCELLYNEPLRKCKAQVWDRPWLEDGRQINVNCDDSGDKDIVISRKKRSANLSFVGGQQNKDSNKYESLAKESLQHYLQSNDVDEMYEVVRVENVTVQVVAGTLTRILFKISPKNSKDTEISCSSRIWDRPWLNSKEINTTCDNINGKSVKKRHVPGGVSEKDPNDPRYKQLALDSLKKFLQESKITQHHELISVKKVTKQIVSGSITKIDFTMSPTNCELDNNMEPTTSLCTVLNSSGIIGCHSEISEQAWLHKKEIKVTCDTNDEKIRKKRQVPGGENEQNVNDSRYQLMAEESLKKFLQDTGSTQHHELIGVKKVITQGVAGSLTKIDFTITPTNCKLSNDMEPTTSDCAVLDASNIISCHSEIWEQQWLNKKEINVSCDVNNHKRRRRSLKGKKVEQDPNLPEFKLLAQESLQKYQKTQINTSSNHEVTKVEKVDKQLVSGVKFNIDFIAKLIIECTENEQKALGCKHSENDTLYCHSTIWKRPWKGRNKVDVNCNRDISDEDSEDYRKKRNVSLGASEEKDVNNESYKLLAEQSLVKYQRLSNAKNIHKIVKIHHVTEQVVAGILTTIEYSISPTECLIEDIPISTDDCNILAPKTVLICQAKIWDRPWMTPNKDIAIECKNQDSKNIKSGRKIAMDNKNRNKRQVVPIEDYIDEDIKYYYADRAIQHINDKTDTNNIQKLVTIHAIQNVMNMGINTVRMFIETAFTYCIRHQDNVELSHCEELTGMYHRLCYVRLWPSPDDELVIQSLAVVCDDEPDFKSITGISKLDLIKASLKDIEASSKMKYKVIHQGEPNIIPSLDSRTPFVLSFVIVTTNCSKYIDIEENPFSCYADTSRIPRSCTSSIWMVPNSKKIKKIKTSCRPDKPYRSKRSISLESTNVTTDEKTIQNFVKESLEKLEMSSLHKYKQRVLQINSFDTKITKGRVTTIDFDVGYTTCLKYEWVDNITQCEFIEHLPRRHCISQIRERLWLNNGKQIEVNCEDDETPLEATIEFESAENAMQLAREALKHIEAKYPHPRKQKVVRIFSLDKQDIAGVHYRMKMEVGYTDCLALSIKDDCNLVNNIGLNKFCRANIWLRPWTEHLPTYRVSCDYQDGITEIYHKIQTEHLFSDFLTTYKPDYINDHVEMLIRYEIFANNVGKIHELNTQERGTARYAVTRFSDLTYEEFGQKYLGLKPNLRDSNQIPIRKADIPQVHLPDSFDWRQHDAVTEVKDQGGCGSCWAFSVTGNIEGQWKMQSGQLVSLSEQELVDCDKLDQGCNGGLPDNAYRAIEQLGGLEAENDYPYEGENDKCSFNKTLSRVQISGAVNISSNETDMAKWLLQNGPISIGINANAMQFYVGGVSHPWRMLCNPSNLDHGVLIVGYGVKDYPLFHKRLPYWIVKNSWGARWGEQGYYRVYRGDGTCGVNQMASSAVI